MHFFLCIVSQRILIYVRCKMWHHPPSNHPSTHPSILAQSCLTLCDPMDCSPPGSSVPGILQEEHWRGLPLPPPGDLPDQGSNLCPCVSCNAGGFLPLAPRGSPHSLLWYVMCNIRYVWYVPYVIYVTHTCDVTPHIHPRWRHTAALAPASGTCGIRRQPSGRLCEGRGERGLGTLGAPGARWCSSPDSAGYSVGACLDNSLSCRLLVCVFSVRMLYFY